MKFIRMEIDVAKILASLAGITVIVSVAASSCTEVGGESLPRAECSVKVDSVEPAQLQDGRVLTVDAYAVAQEGQQAIFTGATGWAHQNGTSASSTKTFGFIRESHGHYLPIPLPPLRDQRDTAWDGRAVGDGEGGWHFIYGERQWSRDSTPAHRAKRTLLWYSHLVGGAWRDSRVVAELDGASLSRLTNTGLVSLRDSVYLAVGNTTRVSRGGSASVETNGLVLIRFGVHGNELARQDTVHTTLMPQNVTTALRRDSITPVAYFTETAFYGNRNRPDALFMSSFTHSPEMTLVYADTSEYVTRNEVITSGNKTYVTMLKQIAGKPLKHVVKVALDSAQKVVSESILAEHSSASVTGVLALSQKYIVWAIPDDSLRNTIQFYVGDYVGAEKINTYDAHMLNFRPLLVRESDSTFFFVTAGYKRSNSDSVVTTLFAHATLRCSDRVKRAID
ncbi:MAG: hypothetical protein ABI852_13455 [Gemmatimonadaceae bacterium]